MFMLFMLFSLSLMAQAPAGFSYQAVVRSVSGQLISNQQIGVQIKILRGSVSGSSVYTENHHVTTNSNGLLTLMVGAGTAINGSLSSIAWGDDVYFIETNIDPTGGFNYSITSTSQLLSVPYALHAESAQSLSGSVSFEQLVDVPNDLGFSGDYDDLSNKPELFDGEYSSLSNVPELSVVATTGSYTDLINLPSVFTGSYDDLTNRPVLATVATSGQFEDLVNVPELATVAFSGNYNDLLNKPIVGANGFSGDYNDLINRPNVADSVRRYAFNGNYNELTNVPEFSLVAFSGNYNDLQNRPTLRSEERRVGKEC